MPSPTGLDAWNPQQQGGVMTVTEHYECPNCNAAMGIAGGFESDDDLDALDYFNEQVRWHESGECSPQGSGPDVAGEGASGPGQRRPS